MALIRETGPAGALELECADTWLSRWRCASILRGDTYPVLPVGEDVKTIVDVGANCGATSVLLAARYPAATVHALEPGSEAFAMLRRNSERQPGIVPHNVGLSDRSGEATLYLGELDTGTSSIFAPVGAAASETVSLRAADEWLEEQGVERIDVLKVDVEGSELPVLGSMARWLPSVRLIHIEYGGKGTGREIDDLLRDSHLLALGSIMLTHGEVTYVAEELAGDEMILAIGELTRRRVLAQARIED